jgi:hypothetical protein
MTTQTFIPGVGKSSETNANDVTTYYEYDDNQRLSLVRDEQRNILKRMAYHQVNDQTEPTLLASHPYALVGEPVPFSAEVFECGNPTYYWNFGDPNTPGGGTQKGTATPTHTYSQIGTYTVLVVADNPERPPIQKSLTVKVAGPLNASIFTVSGNLYYDICTRTGSAVEIKAVGSGGCGSVYTYRWESRFMPANSSVWSGWSAAGSTDVITYHHTTVGFTEYQCYITDDCGRTVATASITGQTDQSDPDCY